MYLNFCVCAFVSQLKDYPQFMTWWRQDFPPEEKAELLRDLACMISERELSDQMDAQVTSAVSPPTPHVMGQCCAAGDSQKYL